MNDRLTTGFTESEVLDIFCDVCEGKMQFLVIDLLSRWSRRGGGGGVPKLKKLKMHILFYKLTSNFSNKFFFHFYLFRTGGQIQFF